MSKQKVSQNYYYFVDLTSGDNLTIKPIYD